MDIKPIKNEKDYELALQKIEEYWDANLGSPEGDILEVLSILVSDYEKKHYNILPPDPISAILFRMEQLGMKQKDLGLLVGGANRASELLHGKRELTVKMIATLSKKINIPPESLLGLK
jgi:HTH-type transcriptional regulator / antitoxin HigA